MMAQTTSCGSQAFGNRLLRFGRASRFGKSMATRTKTGGGSSEQAFFHHLFLLFSFLQLPRLGFIGMGHLGEFAILCPSSIVEPHSLSRERCQS